MVSPVVTASTPRASSPRNAAGVVACTASMGSTHQHEEAPLVPLASQRMALLAGCGRHGPQGLLALLALPPLLGRTAEVNLFQTGDFTLSSGEKSFFKIECEALTSHDWETLAEMLAQRVPAFSRVISVPTGGDLLAICMRDHVRPNTQQVLIVDDVLTSGGSMNRARDRLQREEPGVLAIGAVIFAREFTPFWVYPLFQMTPVRHS